MVVDWIWRVYMQISACKLPAQVFIEDVNLVVTARHWRVDGAVRAVDHVAVGVVAPEIQLRLIW